MDPIQAAIEAIESLAPGEHFTYREVAKKFGVERSTLARRHQGKCQPRGVLHRRLQPQQEKELVEYIQGLTARRTPPTREMIKNFASTIAKKGVSDTWVSSFLNRHSDDLILR